MDVSLQYSLELEPESRWYTISATASSKTSLLFLQEAGDFYCRPGYYTTREGYASYLIKLTISGCGELTYQDQTYSVPPGHFFWLDCRKWQSYRTHPDAAGWHTIWIHFYGNNAAFYYDLFCSRNNGSPVASLPAGSILGDLISQLLVIDEAGDNPQIRDLKAADLLNRLISHCTMSAMTSAGSNQIPQNMQNVRMYLAENYREKLSLEALGLHFNMNPFYLQKQFKRHIGQTPTEYLIYMRMTKAKQLLRTTDKSVSQVANMVGIDNLGHFTRQFKKLEGITPHEYRKLWPAAGQSPLAPPKP